MKGLTGVLDRFTDGLRVRKILPSLLEEMKDPHLLPYILPNVFAIATIVSPQQFASLVLPSLKPLFAIKEPPQNMLTLLDNLNTLQEKTDNAVFREHVLPLVYNALESEHAPVQERALGVVPGLCESIDYAEVQSVLFPRVALVFTKTRILSVKVATLVTFLSMIKTLDQTSLTQKLVPLLSKIRTKEPAVTMATLSVQEAMGLKVDREAVATLVLPQLWAMSIGPLLNVEQFQRFMAVIKKLGDRVEKEHDQFLRDSQRIEDRSATTINGSLDGLTTRGGMDFETLVGGAGGGSIKADTEVDGNWEDDVWGSILSSNSESPSISQTTFASSMSAQSQATTQSLPSSPRMGTSIGAAPLSKPLTSRTTTGSNGLLRVGSSIAPPPLSSSTLASTSSHSTSPPPAQNARSKYQGSLLSSQGTKQSTPQLTQRSALAKPNYNILLSDVTTNSSQQPPPLSAPFMTSPSLMNSLPAGGPTVNALSAMPVVSPPAFSPRQGMGDILTPLKPQRTSLPGVGTKTQASKDILSDFDPLA